MTKAERAARVAWLAALKAGDEVVVEHTARGSACGRIARVESRTKAGIWIDTVKVYAIEFLSSNGRVEARNFYGSLWITPVTEAHRMHASANTIRQRIGRWSSWNWGNLSDATTLAIGALLDAEARKKENGT